MRICTNAYRVGLTGRYWDSKPHAVTFDAEESTITVIVGGRGSSKTALALGIGQLVPDPVDGEISGEISIDFDGPNSKSDITRPAVLTQASIDWSVSDTVFGEIAFTLEGTLIEAQEIADRVKKIASTYGLEHKLYAHPRELSGGQRQRLAVASHLVGNLPIICFDEPFRGIDYAGMRITRELLSQLRTEGRTIIIFTTQISPELRQLHPNQWILLTEGNSEVFKSEPDLIEGQKASALDFCAYVWNRGDDLQREFVAHQVSVVDGVHINAAQAQPIIRVDNLVVNVFDKFTLGPLSLSRSGGGITAILGPNGSGKTTFAKLAAWPGYRPHKNGYLQTIAHGQDPSQNSFYYMAQESDRHYSQFRCIDELILLGMSVGDATGLLEKYGISNIAERDPFSINGPNQQLLALALAEASNSQIVFLDEPTSLLDAAGVIALVRALSRYTLAGRRVFLITHDSYFASQVSDDFLVFSDGRISFDGTLKELISKSEDTEFPIAPIHEC